MPPGAAHIDGVRPFFALLGLASVALVALAVLHEPDTPATREASTRTAVEGGELAVDSVRADRARKRRAIGQGRTYLPYIVRQDSTLVRWANRSARPIAIYFPLTVTTPGYVPEFKRAVSQAFARWERVAGVPIRFGFTPDTAAAEVTVIWRSRLPGDRTGEAEVQWDPHGWIRNATLTLATLSNEGAILSTDAVYTVALHEIGHLLGIGHSDHVDDLMHPSPGVHDLTARDLRTAALLYSLQPGSLRDPGAQ